MDLLVLPRGLRAALQEVWRSGGRRSLHVNLDQALLDDLRSNFYLLASRRPLPLGSPGHALDEFIEADRFERRITYCLIRLREIGVPQEKYVPLLRKALESAVEKLSENGGFGLDPDYGVSDLDEIIVRRLATCFFPHYYPSHFLHYEILEEHALIFWDDMSDVWRLTNLGKYARELNTFSLLLFLLAIEFSFSKDTRRGRYPTLGIAESILSGAETENRSGRRNNWPRALRWYGIIDDSFDRRYAALTEFGRQLLVAAVSRYSELRDLILLLTESEHYCISITSQSGKEGGGESVRLDTLGIERFLTKDQASTFKEVMRLNEAGNHLDALRLVYPLIEATLNAAVSEAGLSLASGSGLRSKIDALVVCGRLPLRLGSWAEIVTSRNKVVHGNIDSTSDLLAPLFTFVAGFFRELLQQLGRNAPVASVETHNPIAAPDSNRALRGRRR